MTIKRYERASAHKCTTFPPWRAFKGLKAGDIPHASHQLLAGKARREQAVCLLNGSMQDRFEALVPTFQKRHDLAADGQRRGAANAMAGAAERARDNRFLIASSVETHILGEDHQVRISLAIPPAVTKGMFA